MNISTDCLTLTSNSDQFRHLFDSSQTTDISVLDPLETLTKVYSDTGARLGHYAVFLLGSNCSLFFQFIYVQVATSQSFKPPPPVGAGGGYMFSGRPSVHASVPVSVRPSVRDSRGSFMFPRYLQYLLTDFLQTFVTGASRDRDELIRFWGQKVKVQGHGMTKCIPDFHVCTIAPVSIDRFSPNFCHRCILGTQMT